MEFCALEEKNISGFASLNNLIEKLNGLRDGKKIILCHGVFDLLHIGHIKHFQSAKALGDILVVTVTPDRFVNKGPGRPCFTEKLRAQAIAALDCVDFVAINEWPTAIETIHHIKPAIYAKGSEYRDHANDLTAKIQDEIKAIELVGGCVAFTDDITFSSSSLINQYFPAFSDEVMRYLNDFKHRYVSKEIIDYLEKAAALKVLVLGETIIDEYCYCDAMAKSGKEPVLATKHLKKECYIGGILAVANHMASFCDAVDCVTFLGENGEYEDYIRKNIKKNVKLEFFYKDQSPTLVKRRYVENYLKQKLFEIYEMNDDPLKEEVKHRYLNKLKETIAKYDLVLVADYGHAMIDDEIADFLCDNAKFLAVNTQANAGNQGFNVITKYKRADFISIAKREMNLALNEKNGDPIICAKKLAEKNNYGVQVVTCGKEGSVVYSKHEDSAYESPSLACEVRDRVGAGDAVLAITSLYAALGAPAEVIGFITNVVGAEAVTIMGHERFIEKAPLMKHIAHLLK